MGVILSLIDLTKNFGDTRAVDRISLDIMDGEMIVLLGPSGCGKTTTLRLIAGFLEPEEGGILLKGEEVSGPGWSLSPERRQMGMVFQSYALWPHMKIASNVAYGLRVQKGRNRPNAEEIEAGTLAALETVQMGDYGDRYPAEISGGQQQRVALARALAVDPTVLLLDEPLSNLDAQLREKTRIELKRLHEQLAFTGVYVTHDQAEALALGDRIVIMRKGQIEQVGTPQEVFTKPVSAFVATFLGGAQLLPGTVIESGLVNVNESLLRVNTAEFQVGKRVLVVCRPSNWIVGRDLSRKSDTVVDEQISKVFMGTVRDLVFGGDRQDCSVFVDELDILAWTYVSPAAQLQPGDRVEVSFASAPAVVPATDRLADEEMEPAV